MEKTRNKNGKVISYREKVYVNGRPVTKTFKRKNDALAWKKNYSLELQRKKALGIEDIKSIDFESFSKLWLEIKQNQDLAQGSMESYSAVIKLYLLPSFNRIKLEKINQGNAQKVIGLSKENRLSTTRINFNLRVLKQMLNDAVSLNYLIRNPLVGMKKFKEQPRSLNYWLPQQIDKFLSSNVDDPFYPLFVVALNTGLRRGELLGLCWDKVNLDERRIEICRIKNPFGLKETTKTGMIRYLPLNDPAWKALKDLSGRKTHPSFVFTKKDGTPPHVYHLSQKCFRKAIERAGVPRIRFHDLRTTYASNFVMAGGNIFALSKLLGHTSVEMTAKKYAALDPQYMKKTVHTVNFGEGTKKG